MLFGAASVIHRSGWLYDRIGWPRSDATNAIRLPSGDTARLPMLPSMLAIFTIAPPAAGTANSSAPASE